MNTKTHFKDIRLGVLVSPKTKRSLRKLSTKTRLLFLVHANLKTRLDMFFFTISDIDYTSLSIHGIYYDLKRKIFCEKIFPFPHLMMNRSGAEKNQRLQFEHLCQRYKELDIPSINIFRRINKWKMYCDLKKNPKIKPHLPHTQKYKGLLNFTKILNATNNPLYLKACCGNKGYQVMRVSKMRTDLGWRYRYSYCSMQDEIKTNEVGLKQLKQTILEFFQRNPFVIQEAIDLLTWDGKIIDIRAELQRNGKGEIEIVGICIRLGMENSPITTHFKSYALEDFFKKILHYSEEQFQFLSNRLKYFLLQVYQSIEANYGKTGELGIDVGLDKNHKLWLIECNSQPTKISLIKAFEKETIERAFINLLEYGKYLYTKKQGTMIKTQEGSI
jgi:hypothetical protein